MVYINVQGKEIRDIELFALSTCGWCRKLKQFLIELNVAYKYIDLDLCDDDEQDALTAKLDSIDEEWAFPVILVDETVMIVGFDTDAILRELGIPAPTAAGVLAVVSNEEIEKTRANLDIISRKKGYHLNPDRAQTSNLISGLHTNRKRYGYWACPCRIATGDREKDRDILCPCDYMAADLEEFGCCFCALYVSDDVISGKKKVRPIPERRNHS